MSDFIPSGSAAPDTSFRRDRRPTSHWAAVARQLYQQAIKLCAEIRGRVPRHLVMAMEHHGPLVQLARHCLLVNKPGIFRRAKEKAGPGDPAAPRLACLPLRPSGPGGVHRILLHRAQPLYSWRDMRPTSNLVAVPRQQYLRAIKSCAEIRCRVPRLLLKVWRQSSTRFPAPG